MGKAAGRSCERRSASRPSPRARFGSSTSEPSAAILGCSPNTSQPREPQPPSAARACGAIQLGSSELVFAPTHPPQPGSYLFDVAEIAGHGSAGSTILILQTLLVPLALAQGDSTVVVLGGTHQDWAPAYDDLANAYLPALRRMGLSADAELKRWGWYPAGGGEVVCKIKGGPDRAASRLLAAADRGARARASPPDHRPGRRRQPSRSHRPTHVRPGTCGPQRPRRPRPDRTSAREGGLPRGGNFSVGRLRDLGGKFLRPWAPGKAVRSRCGRGGCRLCASIMPRVPPSNCTLPTSFCCRSPSPLVPPPSPWHVRPRTSPPMPGRLSSSVSPKSRSSRGS